MSEAKQEVNAEQHQQPEQQQVYQSLIAADEKESPRVKADSPNLNKWTLYLIMCCITASMSSFIFGFNIGSTNLPTPLIQAFFKERYFAEYETKKTEYETRDIELSRATYQLNLNKQVELNKNLSHAIQTGNTELERSAHAQLAQLNNDFMSSMSMSFADYLTMTAKQIADHDADGVELESWKNRINEVIKLLWTVTTALFVVGGIIGAFTSKYVQDAFGRKKGILFHHVFTLVGSVLVLIAPYINSPECVIISRFMYGVQGGMTCGLIPTYLSEISPPGLRGATGVIHQLFLTIGILVAQTLGFRQLLGTRALWNILLALPIVPGLLGSLVLLLFFGETPRALLINNRDEDSARNVLARLRSASSKAEIDAELEEMRDEAENSAKANADSEAITLGQLFTIKELRWPLITGIVLQLTQQLCGINAIFFYSESIFRNARVEPEFIQYAIFTTGAVNVVMTIVCVPLIDRLGRKPLLIYPMLLIIVDFVALTVFLIFQDTANKAQPGSGIIYSYMSIVCIIVFIMSFAVGLGPIPFIYVAECFRQDARSAALAICMFVNWVANLALTIAFPYMATLLKNYVFLVFTAIVAFAVVVIFKKVPETKNRSVEEIMTHFNGSKTTAQTGGKAGENDAAKQRLLATGSKA